VTGAHLYFENKYIRDSHRDWFKLFCSLHGQYVDRCWWTRIETRVLSEDVLHSSLDEVFIAGISADISFSTCLYSSVALSTDELAPSIIVWEDSVSTDNFDRLSRDNIWGGRKLVHGYNSSSSSSSGMGLPHRPEWGYPIVQNGATPSCVIRSCVTALGIRLKEIVHYHIFFVFLCHWHSINNSVCSHESHGKVTLEVAFWFYYPGQGFAARPIIGWQLCRRSPVEYD